MAWTDMTTRADGYHVTAADWNAVVGNFDQMQTWTNYTPALTASTTNPTLGSGAVTDGHYMVVGDGTAHGIVYAYGEIIFGTSGTAAGTGNYIVSLPIAAVVGNVAQPAIGQAYLYDSSTGTWRLVVGHPIGSNLYLHQQNATVRVRHDSPWAWGASDAITYSVTYRI